MDQAIAGADKGLKWTIETSLVFDVYARSRHPEKARRLIELVRQGKMEIAGLYANIEQEFAAPEELVRATYFAAEKLRREYGVELKSAMLLEQAQSSKRLRLPAPEEPEPLAVPADEGIGLDDHQRHPPIE